MKKVFKRLGRAALSLLLAGAVVYCKKDPKYIVLAPVIQALGKWLRENIKGTPIPF